MELSKAVRVLVVLVSAAGNPCFLFWLKTQRLKSNMLTGGRQVKIQSEAFHGNSILDSSSGPPLAFVENFLHCGSIRPKQLFRTDVQLWLFAFALWPFHPFPGVDQPHHSDHTHDDGHTHPANKERVSAEKPGSHPSCTENLETLWTNSCTACCNKCANPSSFVDQPNSFTPGSDSETCFHIGKGIAARKEGAIVRRKRHNQQQRKN